MVQKGKQTPKLISMKFGKHISAIREYNFKSDVTVFSLNCMPHKPSMYKKYCMEGKAELISLSSDH